MCRVLGAVASGDLPDHLLPSAGQSNPFMEKPNPLRWGATVCGVAGVLGVGEGHLLHRKLIGGVGVFMPTSGSLFQCVL